MSILEALLLGVVQGLTEFLPISSSGHLILVPWLQDYTFLQENESFNKTFDVALHAGTLVAVIGYFRRELTAMALGVLRSLRTRAITDDDQRLGWAVVVGTIPAVIVGGLGEDWIDEHLGEPWMIAILLIVFGLVLAVADRLPQRRAIDEGLPDGVVGPMIVGTIASAISSYAAIAWMLAYVRRRSYDVFVVYRVIAGLVVLGLIATGVREATF